MNKKYLGLFLLGLFVFSMLGFGLVSAEDKKGSDNSDLTLAKFFSKGGTEAAPFWVYALFGRAASEDLFTVILMFILSVLAIYGLMTPFKFFGNNEGINWGIAIIVSLIGIRYLPENIVSIITSPSSALVAVIVAGVPFLVLLGITSKNKVKPYSSFVWFFYTVFCLVIGIYNASQEKGIISKFSSIFRGETGIVSGIFLGFAVLGIIMLIAWRRILNLTESLQRNERIQEKHQETLNSLETRIKELDNQLKENVITKEVYDKQVKAILDSIEEIKKKRK